MCWVAQTVLQMVDWRVVYLVDSTAATLVVWKAESWASRTVADWVVSWEKSLAAYWAVSMDAMKVASSAADLVEWKE